MISMAEEKQVNKIMTGLIQNAQEIERSDTKHSPGHLL